MTKTADWTAPTGRNIDPVLVQALVNAIGNTFFHVHFYAKDGEIRAMPRARLNVTSRMADNGETGTNAKSDATRATLAAHDLIPVVDLNVESDGGRDKGWRSFKAHRIAYIKGAGVTYTATGYDPAPALAAYKEKRAEKDLETLVS